MDGKCLNCKIGFAGFKCSVCDTNFENKNCTQCSEGYHGEACDQGNFEHWVALGMTFSYATSMIKNPISCIKFIKFVHPT